MASRDPRVDQYIANAQPFAKPILKQLRKAIHAGCPDVEETMKWSVPHFQYKGMLCSMAAFKEHCAFGFWHHTFLSDDQKSSSEEILRSQRREYIEWVVEAKAEDTRQRRLETAIEWMAEGKVRNWKYMAR